MTSGCSITTLFIIQVSGITQPVVVRDDEPQEMGVQTVYLNDGSSSCTRGEVD